MKARFVGANRYPLQPVSLMFRMYRVVLPAVKKELAVWHKRAEAIPDEELRRQALASISTKAFHCQGGAVYATGCKQPDVARALIRWIIAFQTISDYLDNLCDRSTSLDAEDFRCLHDAMLDAVDHSRPIHDYYAKRSEQADGGYLRALVETCREITRQLPSYGQTYKLMLKLVGLYCDLQVFKHIHHDLRESALDHWWQQHRQDVPDLMWQEFAAATGSTLGVFYLLAIAAEPELAEERALIAQTSYFPMICSLHIMLDYLIDREEDLAGGDLNFCSYYANEQQLLDRLLLIADEARKSAERLPQHAFHRMVVEGLLALYLSDKKVRDSRELSTISRELLRNGPFSRKFFYWNSILVRKLF